MRYRILLLGGALTVLAWALVNTAPPVESQSPPPLPEQAYTMTDCAQGRPFAIRGPADGQATGLAQPALELDKAHPPLRCATPRTDAEIASLAQGRFQRLQQALLDDDAASQALAAQGKPLRLHGPFRPQAGQLRQWLTPQMMATLQLPDRGEEIWYVLECYCDSHLMGLRLGYVELLLMRQRRDVPGIQYHGTRLDAGWQRFLSSAQ